MTTLYLQRQQAWAATKDYESWAAYMNKELNNRTVDDFFLDFVIRSVPEEWCDKLVA